MLELAIVAAGGAIGAGARWWVGSVVTERMGSPFPWGTLLVNVTGAFLLGLLMALSTEKTVVPHAWRLFAGVGVLGGYTTFSALSYESMRLLEQGLTTHAIANIVGSGAAGLVAVAAGLALGRLL